MPSAKFLVDVCDSTRKTKTHQLELVGTFDRCIANKFYVAVVPRQSLLVVITAAAAYSLPKAAKLF
jgi:hypothetical protein